MIYSPSIAAILASNLVWRGFAFLACGMEVSHLVSNRTLDHEAPKVLTGRYIVQAEVLVPTEFALAAKAFLRAWYVRMGYVQTSVGSLDEIIGVDAAFLAMLTVPCDLIVYKKDL